MDRHGEHIRPLPEDALCAVAVMHVDVEDGDSVMLRIGERLLISNPDFSLFIQTKQKVIVLINHGQFFKQYHVATTLSSIAFLKTCRFIVPS